MPSSPLECEQPGGTSRIQGPNCLEVGMPEAEAKGSLRVAGGCRGDDPEPKDIRVQQRTEQY